MSCLETVSVGVYGAERVAYRQRGYSPAGNNCAGKVALSNQVILRLFKRQRLNSNAVRRRVRRSLDARVASTVVSSALRWLRTWVLICCGGI